MANIIALGKKKDRRMNMCVSATVGGLYKRSFQDAVTLHMYKPVPGRELGDHAGRVELSASEVRQLFEMVVLANSDRAVEKLLEGARRKKERRRHFRR